MVAKQESTNGPDRPARAGMEHVAVIERTPADHDRLALRKTLAENDL